MLSDARIPAEVFHPSAFIQDELTARGWDLAEMIQRGGTDDPWLDLLAWQMYFSVHEPGLIIGEDGIKQLSRAFDVSEEFFRNLERFWIEGKTRSAPTEISPSPS